MGGHLTWRVIARSEVGTSHVKRGLPCDDDCWFAQYELRNGDALLAVVVADGAGSASHGGDGAQTAIASVEAALTSKVVDPEFDLSRALAESLTTAAHEGIAAKAAENDLQPRDYACTLLGALSAPSLGTLAFQIGDGGIVLDTGNGLRLAVVPMGGEYANMTHFVTQVDYLDVMATYLHDAHTTRLAALTDGIQRLALDLATDEPHEPFFRPFFDVLLEARSGDEDLLLEQLSQALGRFLRGATINERTDDDKTLAIAVWLGDADERDPHDTDTTPDEAHESKAR